MKKYIFVHQKIKGIRIEIDAKNNTHAWDKLSYILDMPAFSRMDLQEIIIPKEIEQTKYLEFLGIQIEYFNAASKQWIQSNFLNPYMRYRIKI